MGLLLQTVPIQDVINGADSLATSFMLIVGGDERIVEHEGCPILLASVSQENIMDKVLMDIVVVIGLETALSLEQQGYKQKMINL